MAKISFVTFGCTLNASDSELMAGLLADAGHEIVEEDTAELIVINSCTVKALAEKKFFRKITELEKKGKKLILAGCIPQAQQDLVKDRLKEYSVIGTGQLNNIVDAVDETLAGSIVHWLKKDKNPRLNLPKIRRNKVIEIIPICEGCLGNCTYCQTRQARGKLISYDPNAIVKQVKSAVKDGCKEIWLTSQDCGAYGKDLQKDINTSNNTAAINIVELLKRVLSVDGDFFVRLGMTNPNFVLEHLDALIEIYSTSPKLFKFIHIPIQAGNDQVLKDMNRFYTVEDFRKIVKTFRAHIPQITIATDMICGFPTETEKQFEDSIKLITELTPDIVNVSRFWPRQGTPAAKMKQHTSRETKTRSRKMASLFDSTSTQRLTEWTGWQGPIIIDAQGKKSDSNWLGRNYAYKLIAIKGDFKLGQKVEVKVVRTTKHYLVAEPVERK